MNDIKKTAHYEQIQHVYPSDLATLIATYLLEKKEKKIKSRRYNGNPAGYNEMSVAGDKIIINGRILSFDDVEESTIPQYPKLSFCVGSGDNIYFADHIGECLTIVNTSTGAVINSRDHAELPWGITMMGEHIFIVGYGHVYKYNTNGEFVLKWDTGHVVRHIKTYCGSLYVRSGNKLIRPFLEGTKKNAQYNEFTGDETSTIHVMTKHEYNMSNNFVIHDEKIYMCVIDGIDVCDMRGEFMRHITVEGLENIVVWNDNIVVNTHNEIVAFSIEYMV